MHNNFPNEAISDVAFPVFFEVHPTSGDATGTVMPFCSPTCRETCGGVEYAGLKKAVEGNSHLSSFGYDPKCEQCDSDIRMTIDERQPSRGLVGFYRPDPGGPKSPNIVLSVSKNEVKVFEVGPGLVFTIDLADWMSKSEMEAHTTALPTNPRYAPNGPCHDLLGLMLKHRKMSLDQAFNALSIVDAVLAAHTEPDSAKNSRV